VSRQTKQAAAAIVRGVLADGGSPTAEVVAPFVRDPILRIEAVVAITGLSKPTVYRLISGKSFPHPLRLTVRARGWRLSEVLAWIEGLEREGEKHSRGSGRGPSRPQPASEVGA
jgi:prophage regulatory protein